MGASVVKDDPQRTVAKNIEPDEMLCCISEIESRQPLNWSDYLKDTLQLDSAMVEVVPTGRFTVLARFAVDKEGKLCDVSVINDPGYGLGDWVKKVISNYSGRWAPMQVNGRKVTDIRTQPITFVIEEEECELP